MSKTRKFFYRKSVTAEACVVVAGEDVDVRYHSTFEPGEPQSWDYPGSAASVEITDIRRLDTEIEVSWESLSSQDQNYLEQVAFDLHCPDEEGD